MEVFAERAIATAHRWGDTDAHLLAIGSQGITFSVKELVKWESEFEFQLVDSHLRRAVLENMVLAANGPLIRPFRMLPERIKTLIRSLVFKMKKYESF